MKYLLIALTALLLSCTTSRMAQKREAASNDYREYIPATLLSKSQRPDKIWEHEYRTENGTRLVFYSKEARPHLLAGHCYRVNPNRAWKMPK